MAKVAKVIELIAEGDTIEKAVQNGVKEAAKSIRDIKGAWVQDTKAMVEDGKVTGYRVTLKLTFVVN